MRVIKADLAQPLVLGKQGEHGVTQIVFDLSGYIKTYGDGVAQLAVKRPGDPLEYAAVLTQTEKTAVWEIGPEWTEFAGQGYCYLHWFVDNDHAKFGPFKTLVQESKSACDAPEPQIGYLDQVLSTGVRATKAAESAEKSAAGVAATAKQFDLEYAPAVKAAVVTAENASVRAEAAAKRAEAYVTEPTIEFDPTAGRWVATYKGGVTDSFPGYDPTDSTLWSFLREDFDRYAAGPFLEQCGPYWKTYESYAEGAEHTVVEDGENKFLMLKCKTSDAQAMFLTEHFMQGEYCVEFDYMPTKTGDVVPGETATDFLETRLFTTHYYLPDEDPNSEPDPREHIRARINAQGRHCLYATGVWGILQSPYTRNADGTYYLCEPNVWYRVKVKVEVGRIVMKIWKRDSESEPIGATDAQTTVLELEHLTPEYLATPHTLRFYYGKMQEEPPTGEGWRMGLDNVKIYRDTKDGIVDKVMAALPVYSGEVVEV